MQRRPHRPHMALAERTITEALRVFSPRGSGEALRHAPAAMPAALDPDALLAMVDEQTLMGEPAVNAVLVYGPAPMLLDTLRMDVTPEEWQAFAAGAGRGSVADRLRIGALRGGVLVALAAAASPQGRLSRLRVLVNPTFRHLGLGHLVLYRAVQQLLREGLLPYATFVSTDLGARALAKAVGFVNVTRAFGGAVPAF